MFGTSKQLRSKRALLLSTLEKCSAIIIFLFSLSEFVNAQDKSDSTEKSEPKPEQGIVGAPFIDYKPETSLAFGAAALYYFHLGNDTTKENKDIAKTQVSRPSSVSLGVAYTLKHQFSTGTDYTLYFSHDNDYIFC